MKLKYTKKSKDKRFATLIASEPTKSIVKRNVAATVLFGTLFAILMHFNDSLTFVNLLSLAGVLIIYFVVMVTIDMLLRQRFKKH